MPSMMRQALNRRYWDRIAERSDRLGTGVQSAHFLGRTVGFIDYHPEIPGTLPEKMIFEELSARHINFAFSYKFGDSPVTDQEERMRPDFWLFDYGIIIELSGWYWHTRDGMYEHDMLKHVLLTAAGFRVFSLMDIDVVAMGAAAALDTLPGLANIPRKNTPSEVLMGEELFDPSAAIKARLQRYPKKFGVSYRDRVYGTPGVSSSWTISHRAPRVPTATPIKPFTHDSIEEGMKELYGKYRGNFTAWIQELSKRFDSTDPEKDEASALFWYWVTWMYATQGLNEGYTWDINDTSYSTYTRR